MKKLLCSISAIVLLASCNETPKTTNPEKQEKEPNTEVVKDTTPTLTQYGIVEGENPLGLTVGEKAPDVTLTFENGTTLNLQELASKQPLVVFFYRGYWCPYCSKYLTEMATEAKELELAGAKLIAITPESYENVAKTKSNTQATFDIVSDIDGSIMKAFKVNFDVTDDYQGKLKKGLNTGLEDLNSSGEAVLPIPATYVIDTDGKITYSFTNPDYTERAPISEILNHIPAH